MGGQEGSRGYLLQAMISIFGSFEDDQWETILIEPVDYNDKADIIFIDEKGDQNIIQVKSSINNFDKADILNLLIELTEARTDAKHYTINLIGTCSADTKKFINYHEKEIDSAQDIKSTKLKKYNARITINLNPIDLPMLTKALERDVYKFLEDIGYSPSYQTLNLITLALQGKFLHFATKGKPISRDELQVTILNWIKSNNKTQIKLKQPKLTLAFVEDVKVIHTDPLKNYYRIEDILCYPSVEKKIEEAKKMLFNIDSIKLVDITDEDLNHVNRIHLIVQYNLQIESELARIENDERQEISKLSEDILGIPLPEGFFNVGKVKRSKSPLLINTRNPLFTGTKEEVQKREDLSGFFYQLRELNDFIIFWKKIQSYRLVPLLLINESTKLQEEVELTMSFSKGVEVLTGDKFPHLKFSENMKLLNEDGHLLASYFQYQQSNLYKEYDYRRDKPVDYNLNFSAFGKTTSHYPELLQKNLLRIFDYQIFQHDEQKTLTCSFKKLKLLGKMALPSYLLVKHTSDFEIRYSINSNQTGESDGVLCVCF